MSAHISSFFAVVTRGAFGRVHRAVVVSVLLGLEIATIVVVQAVSEFGCTRQAGAEICSLFADFLFRGAVMWSLGVLYLLFRGRWILGRLGPVDGPVWPWALLQVAGFLLIMSPLLPGGPSFSGAAPALVAWALGCLLAVGGALFWLVPPRQWARLLREDGVLIAGVLATGLVAPDLLTLADGAWQFGWLTDVTFASVVSILRLFGEVYVDPELYVIGLGDFLVMVGKPCSGIQGLALITLFLLIYLSLERRGLNMRRAWLLLPVGLFLSFVLNVGRISALIVIGASGAPELAVGGFHSQAGWLLFTLLAFALILVSQRIRWFHDGTTARTAAVPPFLKDPRAAMIVPMIVYLLSGVVVSVSMETPDILYPLRMVAVGTALLLFAPLVRRMVRGFDAVALAVGLAVGLGWLLLPGAEVQDTAPALELAALGPAALAFWVAFRLVGTTVLVPVVEEAFFRGYLLRRLDRGPAMRWLALVISTILFAALHERWFVAGLAGLAFGCLMLRRNRLADPIAAHVAANAVVAAWALATWDWSLI
jgi:exosortase E/protease (VPEID-CTERM system)